VARRGFTRNALQNLATMARDGEMLIIPLDHKGLTELGKASRRSPVASMEYLRRRETLLLQAA